MRNGASARPGGTPSLRQAAAAGDLPAPVRISLGTGRRLLLLVSFARLGKQTEANAGRAGRGGQRQGRGCASAGRPSEQASKLYTLSPEEVHPPRPTPLNQFTSPPPPRGARPAPSKNNAGGGDGQAHRGAQLSDARLPLSGDAGGGWRDPGHPVRLQGEAPISFLWCCVGFCRVFSSDLLSSARPSSVCPCPFLPPQAGIIKVSVLRCALPCKRRGGRGQRLNAKPKQT